MKGQMLSLKKASLPFGLQKGRPKVAGKTKDGQKPSRQIPLNQQKLPNVVITSP
jgi:hypothetical protein